MREQCFQKFWKYFRDLKCHRKGIENSQSSFCLSVCVLSTFLSFFFPSEYFYIFSLYTGVLFCLYKIYSLDYILITLQKFYKSVKFLFVCQNLFFSSFFLCNNLSLFSGLTVPFFTKIRLDFVLFL